jgi:DNA-binding NarL/FixJ family response regulator
MIRVLLVDDQMLIRQGIGMLLGAEGDILVVGEAANGREALARVEELHPDVVLMDVRMPEMDGVQATREIHARWPELGVIILTTFDDEAYIFDGLRAGARGYLLKDISSDEMADAVRAVARGGALIQPSVTRKVLSEFARLAVAPQPQPPASPAPARPASPSELHPEPLGEPLCERLTEREMDVMRAIAAGRSNREIAEQLVITEGTVKNHVSNLIAKLGVRDRTQALIRARELGLL